MGGGWGHWLQSDMHMVAASINSRRGRVNPNPNPPLPLSMLQGLAVKLPWLGLGGPILALAAWTGLENGTLAGKAAWGLSGCLTTQSADHCMLVNEWVWLRS